MDSTYNMKYHLIVEHARKDRQKFADMIKDIVDTDKLQTLLGQEGLLSDATLKDPHQPGSLTTPIAGLMFTSLS